MDYESQVLSQDKKQAIAARWQAYKPKVAQLYRREYPDVAFVKLAEGYHNGLIKAFCQCHVAYTEMQTKEQELDGAGIRGIQKKERLAPYVAEQEAANYEVNYLTYQLSMHLCRQNVTDDHIRVFMGKIVRAAIASFDTHVGHEIAVNKTALKKTPGSIASGSNGL